MTSSTESDLDWWNATMLPLLDNSTSFDVNASLATNSSDPPPAGFKEFTRGPFRAFQSGSALIFHSISLFIMLRIAIKLFKADISLMLKTFLVVWIIEDTLC
ncbi:hypothetical protein AAVH_21687, partial [Aphelenchoides avenae]